MGLEALFMQFFKDFPFLHYTPNLTRTYSYPGSQRQLSTYLQQAIYRFLVDD